MVALVLLLLFQMAAPHATPVSADAEVCTSAGIGRVGIQEHGSADAGGAHHDCCCTDKLTSPPAVTEPLRPVVTSATIPLITTSRLAAQWLGPLSTGPPPPS